METIKTKTSIMRFLLILFVFIILPGQLICQSCYNPLIDSMISNITMESICKIVHELTGDTSTIIGGVPYIIRTRAYNYPGNQMAAQYIFEKFESFGYTPRYQTFSTTGENVIAVKTGVKYPNQQYIICGHFDSYPWEERSIGADDDATGTCGVIEAARVLAPYDFDYTIIFIAMDEEERGLFGSGAYADSALMNGDSIMNVINLDMTAYDLNQDGKVDILTNNHSLYYANAINSSYLIYQPELNPKVLVSEYSASDHYSFWERGYCAVWPFENDINPNVNSMRDTITHFNFDYFLKMTRAAVAALAVFGKDLIINIDHEPLLSSPDTTDRVVTAVITSNHPIDRNNASRLKGAPKLYWKVGNNSFNMANAFYINLDTFKFIIPGQPVGSTVSYYLAAQDSLATMVGSLPGGAKGMSPPGTAPPPTCLVYRILRQMNVCSQTIPKSLPPLQVIYDTIRITENGIISDYDLNLTVYHANDSDIYIMLVRSGSTQLQLSTGNGGNGQNYFNTTFDDEAEIPITEGIPPFIGSYRPEMPLSNYDNLSMAGEWVLKIFNNSHVLTGQLTNWCLSIGYYDPIGISNNQIPVKSSLSQNYPNPFNSSTKVSFSLVKKSNVKIAVYDILGREVTVLVNNVFNNGSYNLNFNANNLASGLYFYTMYIDGKLFDSRKMVLIK
jgi:hypothetical protein